MTSHDYAYHGHAAGMADNVRYMLEQAKFKEELESFTWSRNMEEEPVITPAGPPLPEMDVLDIEEESAIRFEASVAPVIPVAPEDIPMDEDPEKVKEFTHDAKLAQAEALTHDQATEVAPVPTVTLPLGSSEDDIHDDTPQVPLPSPSSGHHNADVSPLLTDDSPSPHFQPTDEAKGSAPRPIPVGPKRPVINRDRSDLNLPTGLPSSGLSVSDIMSVPSPGVSSTTRVVRRHKAMPSIDTTPASRLSVDLGGRITHLDDEDWEQLDSAEGIGSIPNMPHTPGGSFFSRVLKRRPSTLSRSGLRRQAKTSDSSDSEYVSPVNGRPIANTVSPKRNNSIALFGKGGGPKKAFEKIKTFPILRKASAGAPPSSYIPPQTSQDHLQEDHLGEIGRPSNPRRHTESGWLEKRRSKKALSGADQSDSSFDLAGSINGSLANGRSMPAHTLAQQEKEKAREKHKEKEKGMMSMSRSVSGIIRNGRMGHDRSPGSPAKDQGEKRSREAKLAPEDTPPRLELTETPPLVWELGS